MKVLGRQVSPALGLLAVLGAGAPATARAQGSPAEQAPGADLRVALVTVGAGPKVFERFGHNMLWIQGQSTPLDSVWDWGRFSFDTERFFVRFIEGDLRYWMKGEGARNVLAYYGSTGRSVTVQELALAPAQRLQLLAFLRSQDTDANRYYQYHYYLDNCSTRIRDALDAVLGGVLRARTDTALTPWSYRDQTKRLNEHNPFLYFGLTTLLAGWTDHRMTAWEEMFLPSGLEKWVREIRVPNTEGVLVPLVAAESVLVPGGDYPVPDAPSRWWPGFLGVGMALLGLLTTTGHHRGGWGRAYLPLAFSWLFLAGLFGATIAFLWAFSGHQVAWRNENLFQFNLLPLVLLPLLPAARQGQGATGRLGRQLALALVVLSLAGLLVKVVPGFSQANWDVMALTIPANLGLFLGLYRRDGQAA